MALLLAWALALGDFLEQQQNGSVGSQSGHPRQGVRSALYLAPGSALETPGPSCG